MSWTAAFLTQWLTAGLATVLAALIVLEVVL